MSTTDLWANISQSWIISFIPAMYYQQDWKTWCMLR